MLQNGSEMYTSINLGENASRFCNGRVSAASIRPRNGKTPRLDDDVRLKLAAAAAAVDASDPYAFTEPDAAAGAGTVRLQPAAAAGVTYARKPLANGAVYPALSASLGNVRAAVATVKAEPGVKVAPDRKRKRPSTEVSGSLAGRERSLLEEQLLGIKAEPVARRDPDPRASRPGPSTQTPAMQGQSQQGPSVPGPSMQPLSKPGCSTQGTPSRSAAAGAAGSSRAAQRGAWIPQRRRRHDAPWHEALQRICTADGDARDFHQHLFPLGVEASESEGSDAEDGVFQRHWFSAAHGQGEGLRRDLRIDLVRCEMRHRVQQVCGGVKGPADESRERLTRAIVATARSHPSHVAAFLSGQSRARRPPRDKRNRSKSVALARRGCEVEACTAPALPCTRHCLRHVVANADQLLFEHCTAKFSDNTQCAEPVFDIAHELPLCTEHARKRDNYDRMCAEVKPKKSRKKAKASAMTRRAAKRGRSKRKRRSPQKLPSASVKSEPGLFQQQPLKLEPGGFHQPMKLEPDPYRLPVKMEPDVYEQLAKSEPGGQPCVYQQQVKVESFDRQLPVKTEPLKEELKLDSMKLEELEEVEIVPVDDYEHQTFYVDEMMGEIDGNLDMYIKEEVVGDFTRTDMPAILKQQTHTGGVEVAEALSLAGLPLDPMELANQAARLLEEHDLNNVLNQIPADAFNDLFTEDKNGAYEPTREETEELERALEAVDKDVKSLEKLSQTQGLLETLMDDPAMATLATLHDVPAAHGVPAGAAYATFHHNGFVAGGGTAQRKCADAANISIQTQTNMPS